MKYATIDTTTMTIWGTGSTAEESAADARDNLADAGPDALEGALETMECTVGVAEEVEMWGGEYVTSPGHEWTIYTRIDGTTWLKMVVE